MNPFQSYLTRHNIYNHLNQGITVTTVADASSGISLMKELLYAFVDKKSVLYLSGGRTPQVLYKELADEEKLDPGAVGIVDERYGKKFHENSNEKMFRETGLLRYLEIKDIPFYPLITDNDKTREEASSMYDDKVRALLNTFQQSIAIMGIGADGHTSGIAPNRAPEFTNPMFDSTRKHLMVSEFDDPKSNYGQRLGMTFLGLSMMDYLFVLIFGEDKKKALDLLFSEGNEEDIPSRFYKRPDIAKKTLFITDQNI